MLPKHPESFKTPTDDLQLAIDKINIFVQPNTSRLEINENGHLVEKNQSSLDRILSLAKSYIGPLFSDRRRTRQHRKLTKIKEEILWARDIIIGHFPLIEKFEQGNSSQRKFAKSAREAIHRFNTIVAIDAKIHPIFNSFYNFERKLLLQDVEIRGHQIQHPFATKVTYNSHPHCNIPSLKHRNPQNSPIHIKTKQFILDTFKLKTIRILSEHFKQEFTTAEIVHFVKQTTIDMSDQTESSELMLKFVIFIDPGSKITVNGTFKLHEASSKFLAMPVLKDIHFTSESIQSGFPYPSQYTGWGLSEKLTLAHPLRRDQVPLYQKMVLKKNEAAQLLLHDPMTKKRCRNQFQEKKTLFDANRHLFLPLHQELQKAILIASDAYTVEAENILKLFYEQIENSSSPFTTLTSLQQEICDKFIDRVAHKLESDWLDASNPLLLDENPQVRFKTALGIINEWILTITAELDFNNIYTPYIHLMGRIFGEATKNILLQYFSEKIGFTPPVLNDFTRKLQISAFQQQLLFFDEFNPSLLKPSVDVESLQRRLQRDVRLFRNESDDESDIAGARISNELEVYFTSRSFHMRNKYRKEISSESSP